MEFNNIDINMCVNLSKLVYTSKSITEDYLILFGRIPISFEIINDSTSSACIYVIKYKNTLILTFKGANIISSIEKDTQLPFLDIICSNGFPRNKYKNLKVHKSFLKQFTELKFQMMDIIHDNKDEINNIIFIGHALGGALSTLAAACCKSHYHNYNVSCITFGSPRVGNIEFSKYFNGIIDYSKRFVYGDDILTKIPYYFYKHVDDKVEIGKHDSNIIKRHFGILTDNHIGKYVEWFSKNNYLED
jgi:predicted lipase